jgi:fatty-acyl-CoA synthase
MPDARRLECVVTIVLPPTEAQLLTYRKKHPGFKTPKAVVFGSIPKTSTGTVHKFIQREQLGSSKAISA